MRRRRWVAVAGVVMAAQISGCAHHTSAASSVVVLAPNTVADALRAAEGAITAGEPGLAISFHFVANSPSRADLGPGGPDIIITSDGAALDELVGGGQVTGAQVFAHQRGGPGAPLTALHVAIVRAGAHRAAAERFTQGLLSLPGQQALRDHGLLSP